MWDLGAIAGGGRQGKSNDGPVWVAIPEDWARGGTDGELSGTERSVGQNRSQ